jgi:hypothetical protein
MANVIFEIYEHTYIFRYRRYNSLGAVFEMSVDEVSVDETSADELN